MSKILGIGLGKTGLTSLHKALEILGYSCIKDFDKLADLAVAPGAICCAANFEHLDVIYPDSKFIYTVRETEAHLASAEKHRRRVGYKRLRDPAKRRRRLAFVATEGFDRDLLAAAYQRHDGRVREYFKGRDDLLVINISGGDGWEKLCPFLNRPVPDTPFPHENRSKNVPLKRRIKILFRRLKSQFRWNS